MRQDRVFGGAGDALVGGGCGIGAGGQVELLCIVSKEYPSSQTNGDTATEKAKVEALVSIY